MWIDMDKKYIYWILLRKLQKKSKYVYMLCMWWGNKNYHILYLQIVALSIQGDSFFKNDTETCILTYGIWVCYPHSTPKKVTLTHILEYFPGHFSPPNPTSFFYFFFTEHLEFPFFSLLAKTANASQALKFYELLNF